MKKYEIYNVTRVETPVTYSKCGYLINGEVVSSTTAYSDLEKALDYWNKCKAGYVPEENITVDYIFRCIAVDENENGMIEYEDLKKFNPLERVNTIPMDVQWLEDIEGMYDDYSYTQLSLVDKLLSYGGQAVVLDENEEDLEGMISEGIFKITHSLSDMVKTYYGKNVCIGNEKLDFLDEYYWQHFNIEDVMNRDLTNLNGTDILHKNYCRYVLDIGLPNMCHYNSSRIFLEEKDNRPELVICTGYALSEDGVWRSHSWLVDAEPIVRYDRTSSYCDGMDYFIIETTQPRLAYYGYVYSRLDSERFANLNIE